MSNREELAGAQPGGSDPTPRAGRSTALRRVVAFSISFGALAWFLGRADWHELQVSLASVKLGWVLAASLILVGEFVLRAARWRVLLRPLGAARVLDLFVAQVIGAAANTLLPLRAGEIAKPYVAARRTRLPIVPIFATAVMERVYDLFGMVSVLLIMVLAIPDDGGLEGDLVANIKRYGGLFGAAAMSAMMVFFLLATRERAARGIFAGIVRVAPAPVRDRLLGLFDGFVAGLGNARDLRGLLQAALLSIWMWVDGALAIWCLFQAFGMELPFGAACFTAVAIALTVALPQAPGFLGVFHVAMEKTMVLWGQSAGDAEGFAIVFWAVSFLPVTLIGLYAMTREGINASTLLSARGGLPVQPSAATLPLVSPEKS